MSHKNGTVNDTKLDAQEKGYKSDDKNTKSQSNKGENSSYDDESSKGKSYSSGFTEEEKHQHHVEGGLKGALKNPNVSDEKKEEIRERLGQSADDN